MEQSAVEWVNNNFEKQIINEDIYASKNGIIESHIIFAKSQQQGFSEEEVFKMIIDDKDAYTPLIWAIKLSSKDNIRYLCYNTSLTHSLTHLTNV